MLMLMLGEGGISAYCCWVHEVLWRSVLTLELVKLASRSRGEDGQRQR